MNLIKVAVIEDALDFRHTLRLLINGTPGFSCPLAYANAESAIAAFQESQPDIVMVDLGLPGMSGIECIRQLKQEIPSLQFLVLTISDEDDSIFEALNAGASGYLLKDATPSKILESIKELHDGGAPMSAQIARKVVSVFQKPRTNLNPKLEQLLTRREKEVLELLATGLLYKQIANQLHISLETVKGHCHNIYAKLHVKNRTEALLKYLKSNDEETNRNLD